MPMGGLEVPGRMARNFNAALFFCSLTTDL
jgi:hypothetical protein